MTWKDTIDSAVCINKNYTDRKNELTNEFDNVVNEIVNYDIDSLIKINFDFYENLSIVKTNPLFVHFAKTELDKFAHQRLTLYKNALQEYNFKTIEKLKIDIEKIEIKSDISFEIRLIHLENMVKRIIHSKVIKT